MYSTRFMSKPHNEYRDAISWLFEQFPSYQLIGSKAYKPTLDNCTKLLKLLGNPQNDLKFVHVAGSNGKGSTCSMIASILTENDYTVGLFTSPHIEDYTERIRIDGNAMDSISVVNFVRKIKSKTLDFSPSFFEMTFVLALDYFSKQKCDICVIETGLGGRLDATNVIQPLLSVITTISLEHTDILGETLEEIALEKAGIIKPTTPVIIGHIESNLRKVITRIAESKKSRIILYDDSITIPIDFPLLGSYQKENYQLAISALNELGKLGYPISDLSIPKGLSNLYKNTGFRARLQVTSKNPLTIIDVSHNADGIRATIDTVNKINIGILHVIFGLSADKNLAEIISVFPSDALLYFTEFSNQRSAKTETITELINDSRSEISLFKEPKIALNSVQNSAKQGDTILIIGSFFLVADYF